MDVRRPRAARLVGVCVVAALGACAAPDVTYVKTGEVGDSDVTAFVKIPRRWTLFDEDELLADDAGDASQEELDQLRAMQWLVGFDSSPEPAPENIGPDARHPSGFVQVRALGPSETDYTVLDLRSELFPVDQAGDEDGFEMIDDDELELPDGLEGFRMTFSFEEDGEEITIGQASALDDEARVIYLLVVGCSATCYARNDNVIDQVFESWTLEAAAG